MGLISDISYVLFGWIPSFGFDLPIESIYYGVVCIASVSLLLGLVKDLWDVLPFT